MRKPSRRHQQYVRKMLNKKECGHWHVTGEVNRHGAVIKHNASGKTLMYSTGDVGADMHSARNFAAQAGAICGCDLAPKRQTRPSRNVQRAPRLDVRLSSAESEALNERDRLRERHRELATTLLDPNSEKNLAARRHIYAEMCKELLDVEMQMEGLYMPPPEGGWLLLTHERGVT